MANSKYKVGMRFTTLVKNQDAVEEIYKNSGFYPVDLEYSGDGHVTLIFSKMSDADMFNLINATPREYSSINGVVVGNSENQRR